MKLAKQFSLFLYLTIIVTIFSGCETAEEKRLKAEEKRLKSEVLSLKAIIEEKQDYAENLRYELSSIERKHKSEVGSIIQDYRQQYFKYIEEYDTKVELIEEYLKEIAFEELNKEYDLIPKENSKISVDIEAYFKKMFPEIIQRLTKLKQQVSELKTTSTQLTNLQIDFPEKDYEIQLKLNKIKRFKDDIETVIIKLEKDLREIYISMKLNTYDENKNILIQDIRKNILQKADELLISTKVILEETIK